MKKHTMPLALLFALQLPLVAEVRFANIFNDNMVLQRDKPVRVWGWADPGARIEVTLTEDAAVAAPYLPKKAPEPKGDSFWYNGGSSVSLKYVDDKAVPLKPVTVTATADAKGAWVATLGPLAGSFAPKNLVAVSNGKGVAIGNVLIGEVWVCSGQSNMEWPFYFHQEIEKAGAIYNGIRYTARFGGGEYPEATWYQPLADVSKRVPWFACDPATVDNCCAIAYAFAKSLHLYLRVPVGIINNARGGTSVDSWCGREAMDQVSDAKIKRILANYDRKTAPWETEQGRQRLVAEARTAFEAGPLAQWNRAAETARKEGQAVPAEPVFQPPQDPRKGWSEPSGMYNGVVLPLAKLSFRGVLWYQGENNFFGRWTEFQRLFPLVIPGFRKAYGDPELPVGVFDLAGWGSDIDEAQEKEAVTGGYAIMRDAMTRYTDKDPHSGLIAVYDLGHEDIHPLDKLPAGLRAASWALGQVYGVKTLQARGPKFKEAKKAGKIMQVFFEPDPHMFNRFGFYANEDQSYVPCTFQGFRGEPNIRGFTIAGTDRRWYPAKARGNLKGRCVEVWSDLVPEPVAVRYGWASFPNANLGGGEWGENLPVPTFRSDDWPIPGSYSAEYDPAFAGAVDGVLQCLQAIADAQVTDRKVRQAFADIEQNLAGKFPGSLELKKELEELKSLRARMESDLAKEVKAVRDLRLGNSPDGLESKIPGYTKEYLGP